MELTRLEQGEPECSSLAISLVNSVLKGHQSQAIGEAKDTACCQNLLAVAHIIDGKTAHQ